MGFIESLEVFAVIGAGRECPEFEGVFSLVVVVVWVPERRPGALETGEDVAAAGEEGHVEDPGVGEEKMGS